MLEWGNGHCIYWINVTWTEIFGFLMKGKRRRVWFSFLRRVCDRECTVCEPLDTGISFSAGWFSFVSEAFLHIVEKVSLAFIILHYIVFRVEVPIRNISRKCMNVLGCLKTTDWITQLLCNSTGYNRPHSILVENLDKKHGWQGVIRRWGGRGKRGLEECFVSQAGRAQAAGMLYGYKVIPSSSLFGVPVGR